MPPNYHRVTMVSLLALEWCDAEEGRKGAWPDMPNAYGIHVASLQLKKYWKLFLSRPSLLVVPLNI